MKYFYLFNLLIIFLEFTYIAESVKEIHLKTVTGSHELGYFFMSLKDEGQQRHRDIDEVTKNEICRHIFSSSFFEKDYRVYANPYEETVRKKLKKNKKHIYSEFYDTGQRSKNSTSKYIHKNPDTVRSVVVAAWTYPESVFRCLTRHTLTDTIREYFVSSDDYNINRETNSNGWNDFIAGRFVYSVGFADKLILDALAEETGQILVQGTGQVEKFYLEQRASHEPVDHPEFDPVCSLSSSNKLRLCTIVIGSRELSDEYKFEPQDIFIERTCARRKISFKTNKGLRASGRKLYTEWMISCKSQKLENLYQYEKVYISRGYAANCAFVYKFAFGFLRLHYFVDNISVLQG